MAAPSTTSWSGEFTNSNSSYKLGIYVGLSNTSAQTTVSVEVWLWSKWDLSDSSNKYYFNNNSTSATYLAAQNISISHSVSSGSGWSTSNQTKIGAHSFTYTRTTSNQTINCAAKFGPIGSGDNVTVSHSRSYTIPALDNYTVSYNANGGSGAPSSQTKWYGTTLKLSTTIPTRTGYSFQGWGTSSSATTVSYAAGANYTNNAAITLYAIWKANTYTVSYNANGGSGAPSSQTKTYGVTLTLSSTKPTRTNYNFKGWGTSSSSTTVAYASGASYTVNASITLYAVWELAYSYPIISGLSIYRCDTSGNKSDSGTQFRVIFNWATDKTVSSIKIEWRTVSSSSYSNSTTISASGTSGSVNYTCPWSISTESAYNIRVNVSDAQGATSIVRTISGIAYPIDFLSGGKGIAIGKAAESEGLEIDMVTKINKQTIFSAFVVLSNTVNAVGQLRAHGQWLGFYASADNAKNNESRKGYVGYSNGDNDLYIMNSSGGANYVNKSWTIYSDKRLKKDITDIPDVFVDVWKELSPKIFKWNKLNSEDSTFHFGLIAQDVIDAFKKYNLDYREYGFIGTLKLEEDGPEYFGITYDDYYILTDFVLRKTNSRIDNLQSQIDELKDAINNITNTNIEGGN